jgi:hypothetical protein
LATVAALRDGNLVAHRPGVTFGRRPRDARDDRSLAPGGLSSVVATTGAAVGATVVGVREPR